MKIQIKQNMGMMDRCFRIFLGTVLIVLGALMVERMIGVILLVVFSIPLLLTGLTGFCPGYLPFGFSTKQESDCCEKIMGTFTQR